MMQRFLHYLDLFWRGFCIMLMAIIGAFFMVQLINNFPWAMLISAIGAGIIFICIMVGGVAR